jgi:hypothetical protein
MGMGITRRHLLRGAALLPVMRIVGQSGPEGFRAYTDAPRLFLTKARLRLLRRERERRSIRWEQFETLWSAGSEFPEFGWTAALRYQIAQEDAAGRQAVSWAVNKAGLTDASVTDAVLRQIALVADWCEPLMSASDKAAILGRLEKMAGRPAASLAEARTKALAAIVLSESRQAASEKALKEVYEQFWTGTFIAGLRDARVHVPNADAYALLELMHAFRDNLDYDLRESFPQWFKDYALIHILAHYPEPFPAAENEYRIPADPQLDKRGPDVTKATLSRAAELAMVAFDANANETQLLQGFLMNDRFLMRGTLGISYELIWADPYQPGLSYYHVPLVAHDAVGGELYVRSSWEDDAAWLGFFGGHLQLFANGEVQRVEPEAAHDPMDLDEATVFFAHQTDKFSVPVRKVEVAIPAAASAADRADAAAGDSDSGPDEALDDVFIVGLEPRRRYHVEVDHEGMVEAVSDPGGIVYLPGLPSGAVVRFEVGLTS